eukprot:9618492-Alexandrium_andersonii.AAC.1
MCIRDSPRPRRAAPWISALLVFFVPALHDFHFLAFPARPGTLWAPLRRFARFLFFTASPFPFFEDLRMVRAHSVARYSGARSSGVALCGGSAWRLSGGLSGEALWG